MRASLLALLAPLVLAGCGSAPEPLIDRIGVSDAKYNRDLNDCREAGSSGWLPWSGTSVNSCMKGKGYRVLSGGSGL